MTELLTKSLLIEHTQRWTIENFSTLPAAVGDKTCSPWFEAGGHSWALGMYPNGSNDDAEGYVSLYLIKRPTGTAVRAKFSLAVITPAGSCRISSDAKFHLYGPPSVPNTTLARGYSKFAKRDKLLDETEALMTKDTLTIEVKMTIVQGFQHSVVADDSFKLKEGVIRGNARLLESGLHSDVTLIVEGEEIPAHKAILAARSPVFEAMFTHKMSESLEGSATIDDMPFAVFRAFIYAGQLSFAAGSKAASNSSSSNSSSSSSASVAKSSKKDKKDGKDAKQSSSAESKLSSDFLAQLLSAADRFQVADLVDACAQRLASTLTVDNLAERLILADKSRANSLITRCLDFIRADPTRLALVMDSDGYQQLDKAQMHLLLTATLPASAQQHQLSGKKRARPADLTAEPDLQPPSKDAIKRMKVSELKEKLSEKGLETSGLKADLVERLTNAVHGHSVGAAAGSSSSGGGSATGSGGSSMSDD